MSTMRPREITPETVVYDRHYRHWYVCLGGMEITSDRPIIPSGIAAGIAAGVYRERPAQAVCGCVLLRSTARGRDAAVADLRRQCAQHRSRMVRYAMERREAMRYLRTVQVGEAYRSVAYCVGKHRVRETLRRRGLCIRQHRGDSTGRHYVEAI